MSSNVTLPSPMVRINRRCLSMEYLTFISVQFEFAHRWTLAKLSHRFGDLTGDKRGLWKVDSRGPQPIGNGQKAHLSPPDRVAGFAAGAPSGGRCGADKCLPCDLLRGLVLDAIWTHAMAEVCFRVFANVNLKLLPVTFVIANFLAPSADRYQALQRPYL